MKKILTHYFIPVLLMSLLSCEKEEQNVKEMKNEEANSSMLVGEWYRAYSYFVEDIIFAKNFRFTGVVYKDLSTKPKISDNISGSWALDPYTSILSMDIYRTSTGNVEDIHFSFMNWKDYSFELLDKNYGNVETYQRIVESKSLRVNEEYELTYLKNNSIKASNLISSNPSIVSVDTDGHLIAHAIGVTFITISSNVGTIIAKVDVN